MSFGVSRAALLRPSICTPARRLQSSSNLLSSMHRGAPIDIHPEVEDALATNKPVVALESTIITHGMPQPTNLQTARSVESIVRSTGSIPATIGIVGGRVKIGLTLSELEYLADIRSHTSIVKISRRDIAPAIAHKSDGGTTCSATLIFAALSGIKVLKDFLSIVTFAKHIYSCRSLQLEGENCHILSLTVLNTVKSWRRTSRRRKVYVVHTLPVLLRESCNF